MASSNIAAGRAASATLKQLLDSPEIGWLIEELRATRWTGRPGYPIRTMIGLTLVKSLYALPTWTKAIALVSEHWALQRALDCEGEPPSKWAAYRFAEKLRDNGEMVEHCIDKVAWMHGTHRDVSKEHLPVYLDEFVFRHNRRGTPMAAFQTLLGSVRSTIRRPMARSRRSGMRPESTGYASVG